MSFSIKHCASLRRAAGDLKYHHMVKNQNILLSEAVTYTVREPHAMATVELNPIKRSANKAGLGGTWPRQGCARQYLSAFQLSHAVTPLLMQLAMDMPGDILERKQQIRVFSFLFSNTVPLLPWWGLNLIPITSSTNNELFKISRPRFPEACVCAMHMFAFPYTCVDEDGEIKLAYPQCIRIP